jgi:hypothetical protein
MNLIDLLDLSVHAAFPLFIGWHAIRGNTYYTPQILAFFLVVFVVKALGAAAHLRFSLEDRRLERRLWTCIAILLIVMNVAGMAALRAPAGDFALVVATSVAFSGIFVWSLFRGAGSFSWLAASLALSSLAGARLADSPAALGFLATFLAQLSWLAVGRLSVLFKRERLVDAYHLLGLGSAAYLVSTIGPSWHAAHGLFWSQ